MVRVVVAVIRGFTETVGSKVSKIKAAEVVAAVLFAASLSSIVISI